jgi:type II secretory pathway component GspD/PulD (secretin)
MRTHSYTPSALLVALLLAPSAWSQTAPTEQAATPAQPAADVVIKDDAADATGSATKGKDASGADTLSVDFPDEDIRNILRNVADLFELNLVVPEALQGRTSIKLRDVSWRQIFQVVLTPVGFTYIVEGNIIKVVSNESLLQEPATTEVFILNYARASDIKPTLDSLVDASKGGKLVVDGRSNALVITERPSQMNRIRPIIESLDKATDQVMIESKFVEVTNADIKNIGVNWSSLNGMQLTAGGLSQTFDRSRGQTRNDGSNANNTSTLGSNSTTTGRNGTSTSGTTTTGNNNGVTTTDTGPTSTSTTQTNTGNQLLPVTTTDALGNVTTTYSVVPISSTGTSTSSSLPSSQTSVTTGTTNGTTNSVTNTLANDLSTTASNVANNVVSQLAGLTNTSSTNRMTSAVFSASDFSVILSALKTTNDTKLVSNPTVVTLNNSEAQINIGKEFPIPRYTYNAERGTYEVSGFDYRPIGIILKVTPQVNSRGFIKLILEPEVSSSNENANFGTANIPIVTTRKTKTQVSLKDGYTMGIGGLIENNITNTQTRVPVLGSIPVLGRLFRSDAKNDQMRNLIIFITAKTVNAEGAPIEEVFDSRRVRQLQMRRDELPGYRDGSDPFVSAAEVPQEKK